jgi:3-hydroxymyristoyl/3-hydroxydecanoyl-(acyl carrier protein) dehydratase
LTNLALTKHSDKVIWPDLINKTINENDAALTLFIREDLDYFNGHFPEKPILAGVVQLHWAVEYTKQVFNLSDCDVANLEVLKFQVVIVPKQTLILTVTQKSPNKYLFSYVSDRGQHASGRIVFENSNGSTS